MSLKYLPYKHNPPIVWLDTNIINEIVDALKGKTKDNIRRESILRIYSLLSILVEQKKIICPFSGQRTEYGKTDDSEIADDVLLRISNGFQVSGWKVAVAQTERVVNAFCDKSEAFSFRDSDLKYKDDVEPDNEFGFKVVILLERPDRDRRQRLLKGLKTRKNEVISLGLTRQQIYESESSARTVNLDNNVRHLLSKNIRIEAAIEDLYEENAMFSPLYPLYVYRQKMGRHITPEEYKDFISSKYLESVPWDKINSTLFTWLLVDITNLEEQHISDVDNLSKILPYASILVTERQMAHALKVSGLAKEFSTDIFTLKSLPELEKRLLELLPSDKLSVIGV